MLKIFYIRVRLDLYAYIHILIRMPNRTIYIKEQHVDFWDRIKNKSEFVADAIEKLTVTKVKGEMTATLKAPPSPTYKKTSNWGA